MGKHRNVDRIISSMKELGYFHTFNPYGNYHNFFLVSYDYPIQLQTTIKGEDMERVLVSQIVRAFNETFSSMNFREAGAEGIITYVLNVKVKDENGVFYW